MRALLVLAVAACLGTATLADDAPIPTAALNAPTNEAATAAQIEDFIRTSPAADLPPRPVEQPRRLHGSVSLGVGTGGYRSGAVEAHMPLGKTGSVSIGVASSRGPAGLIGACAGAVGGPFDSCLPALP